METLPNDWDELQKSLGASILQSSVWSEFQQNLGRSAYFEWSNHWSWVGFKNSVKGINYLFLPYGPTATLQPDDALNTVIETAKKENFDFVRVEPIGNFDRADIEKLGGIKVAEVEPATTQLIDLTQTEDNLRRGLNSGHRNLINGASRRGLKVRISEQDDDFEKFLLMLHETARRARVKFHDDEYFRLIKKILVSKGYAKLYLVETAETMVAGALFYDYNGTRYYAHAGAFQDINRQLNGSVVLLWQAILDAKQIGMKTVDLWGVTPNDDPEHKWAGISKFKKGFGGKTVTNIGTFEVPINAKKYRAYKIFKKLRGRFL